VLDHTTDKEQITMSTNQIRTLRGAGLLALAVLAVAVCTPAAGAHPEHPHYSFDTLQLLDVAGPSLAEPSESAVVRGPRTASIGIAGSSTKVECIGDGTQGKRVQVMYVRDVDTADGYAANKAAIGAWAVGGDRIFRESAAKTDGVHRVRFVHDANCNLSILNVVVDDAANLSADNLGTIQSLVAAQGHNAANRKYLMFVDSATAMCGRGTRPNDDSSSQSNLANGLPNGSAGYVRIDFDKTNCNPEDWIVAHELSHNLGAVQLSAPHSNGVGHCFDDADRLCQDDGTGLLTTICTGAGDERLLDCNDDDYFNANPPAGSYLDTNWNIANSDFLQAEPAGQWGFVRANDPAAATYTPDTNYNGNSTYTPNTVERVSTGTYAVRFTNLASYDPTYGVVSVTAYGTAGEFCNAAWWNAMADADLTATVDCFDAAGNRADVQFDASFVRPLSTSSAYAYLWADHPTWAGPYVTSTIHQFNSAGTLNEVTRNGTGDYEVRLPGLGGAGGTVKVTAFSSFARTCKVAGWSSSGGDKLVDVLCFDLAGAPVDETFTLVYANGIGILGNGASSGYLRANDADVALATPYTPDPSDQFNSTGATNTVTRTATGLYTATLPGLGDGGLLGSINRGTVHVTASSTSSKRCEVSGWHGTVPVGGGSSSLVADVACHTAAGAPSNSRFVLQFTK